MKNLTKNLKLNFPLVIILLISFGILIIILIGILFPNRNTSSVSTSDIVGTKYSSTNTIGANILVKESDTIYRFNDDKIIIDSTRIGKYFYASVIPNESLQTKIKTELGLNSLELIDNTYIKKEMIDIDDALKEINKESDRNDQPTVDTYDI